MTCVGGGCQFTGCATNCGNCDGNLPLNGCEVSFTFDDDNCGTCNHSCPSNFHCNNPMCRCANDTDCDTGGGGTCDAYYRLCECLTQYCEGPCAASGSGCQ